MDKYPNHRVPDKKQERIYWQINFTFLKLYNLPKKIMTWICTNRHCETYVLRSGIYFGDCTILLYNKDCSADTESHVKCQYKFQLIESTLVLKLNVIVPTITKAIGINITINTPLTGPIHYIITLTWLPTLYIWLPSFYG